MAEESSGLGSSLGGMLNVFVDPGTTAKHAAKPGFWIWPMLTLVIGFMVFGYLMAPFNAQLGEAKFQERAQTQNIPAEQMETARKITHVVGYVLIVVVPVVVILFSM